MKFFFSLRKLTYEHYFNTFITAWFTFFQILHKVSFFFPSLSDLSGIANTGKGIFPHDNSFYFSSTLHIFITRQCISLKCCPTMVISDNPKLSLDIKSSKAYTNLNRSKKVYFIKRLPFKKKKTNLNNIRLGFRHGFRR
ncbi:hypothetical protein AMTRI_Chr07g75980 [Amborella trichopoda]